MYPATTTTNDVSTKRVRVENLTMTIQSESNPIITVNEQINRKDRYLEQNSNFFHGDFLFIWRELGNGKVPKDTYMTADHVNHFLLTKFKETSDPDLQKKWCDVKYVRQHLKYIGVIKNPPNPPNYMSRIDSAVNKAQQNIVIAQRGRELIRNHWEYKPRCGDNIGFCLSEGQELFNTSKKTMENLHFQLSAFALALYVGFDTKNMPTSDEASKCLKLIPRVNVQFDYYVGKVDYNECRKSVV